MKRVSICLCVAASLATPALYPMMNRIFLEKKLEELKEENTQLTTKIEDSLMYKRVILLGSFFSSITIGAKTKSYKAAFIPPLIAFPALLYAQHTINEARKRQEFISPPIQNLQRVISSYDKFDSK